MAEVKVAPIPALEMRVLTEVVNKRNKPYTTLSQILFPESTRSVLPTGSVQIDELTGDAVMAPFIKVGGKAVPLGQKNGKSYQLSTPFISVYRPITASDELLKRMAGQPVFVVNGTDVMGDALRSQTAEDSDYLNEACDMREEWFVSKLLTGTVSYDVDGKDSFTIATGKPVGNDYSVSPLWTASGATPVSDIVDAQTVAQAYRAPAFTHGFCSKEAADAFRALLEAGSISIIKSDSGIAAGNAAMRSAFEENGLRYLGTLTATSVELWEYAATYVDVDNGNAVTPYIRAGYIELVSLSARAMGTHMCKYGAIADIKAIQEGLHMTKRLSFATYDEDAGSLKQYLKSRPFFWFKRPEWYVSIKVTV